MTPPALLQPGVTGAALTARCCFTPRFALLLGISGLFAPLAFAAIALYVGRRRHRE